jgi:DNA polymerase IV
LWRRIDLLFVPSAEIGAALLYFTGNDIFNRSMRLLARKKGMCLNQKGLFADVLRTQQGKLNAGRLVESRNERRIFAVLGVPWRAPEHRVC